jgi:hypothetical protein
LTGLPWIGKQRDQVAVDDRRRLLDRRRQVDARSRLIETAMGSADGAARSLAM